MRINKYLAECGIASRRAAEQYVLDGRVRVNGVVVKDLSVQVIDTDKVQLDNKLVKPEIKKVYIIMNKPRGCVTTCSDDKRRRTVLDVIASKGEAIPRVYPVGRLDYDTEGLLILTNDGDFARKVMHPSSEIQKTYIATVEGPQSQYHISENTCKVTIHEGKNRQVRKMLAEVGFDVINLRRISIGSITLGNLKSGEWKYVEKPFDI